MTDSIYIPRGVNTESLNRKSLWDFSPMPIKVSSLEDWKAALFIHAAYILCISRSEFVCNRLRSLELQRGTVMSFVVDLYNKMELNLNPSFEIANKKLDFQERVFTRVRDERSKGPGKEKGNRGFTEKEDI